MVWIALRAAEKLALEGISVEVINMHTIKPLDEEAILESVGKTGRVVTAEEHMRNGGLGDAVAQVLARHLPTRQAYVAVNDTFGESGLPEELLEKYGLGVADVMTAARQMMG
jgi:transketolase